MRRFVNTISKMRPSSNTIIIQALTIGVARQCLHNLSSLMGIRGPLDKLVAFEWGQKYQTKSRVFFTVIPQLRREDAQASLVSRVSPERCEKGADKLSKFFSTADDTHLRCRRDESLDQVPLHDIALCR